MNRKWIDATRTKHCVYRLDYHIVLVVKYRKKCITEEIGKVIVEEATKIVEMKGGKLLEGKSDIDHVHLLVSLPPALNLAETIGVIKGCTSKIVRKRYQEHLSKYLWGDSFWSPSYYVSTTGGASIETVAQYIESQGEKRKNASDPGTKK